MDTSASGFDTAVAVSTRLPGPQFDNIPGEEVVPAVSGVRALRESTNTLIPAAATAAATTPGPGGAATGESRPWLPQLPGAGQRDGGGRCRPAGDDRSSCDNDGGAAPKSKKRKQSPTSTESKPPTKNADGESCSICLDAWTSNGKHRICALLCGHLFGQSCIERWLKEKRSCPRCGAKVGTKKSIRIIPLFLQNLIAKDTGELDATRKLLEEEKRLRKQCEAERVRLSIHNASLKDQLSRLGQNGSHSKPTPNYCCATAAARSQGGSSRRPSGRQTPMRQIQQPHGQTPKQVFSPSELGCSLPLDGGLGAPPWTPSQMPSERHPPALASHRTGTGAAAAAAEAAEAKAAAAAVFSQHETPPSRRRQRGRDVEVRTPAGSGSGGGGGGGGGGRRSEEFERAAAAAETNRNVGVRMEHLLSRDVQGGRVAAFAGGAAGALLVSQGFGGAGGAVRHGITKFSLADLRHHKNIYLHREQVRDVKFSSNGGGSVGYVLSTSFDRTLKVCDPRTDSVVVAYGLDGNGWSCQWSATNPTQMFCGLVDGTRTAAVQLFDLRSTARAVGKLRAAASQRQPVHSICHTANDLLFCATMGGVWAWSGGTKGDVGVGERQEGRCGKENMAERLQIQAGACCSLSQVTNHNNNNNSHGSSGDVDRHPRFLVSTRGSSASHVVFGLQGEGEQQEEEEQVPQSAHPAQAPAAAAGDSGGTEDSAAGTGGGGWVWCGGIRCGSAASPPYFAGRTAPTLLGREVETASPRRSGTSKSAHAFQVVALGAIPRWRPAYRWGRRAHQPALDVECHYGRRVQSSGSSPQPRARRGFSPGIFVPERAVCRREPGRDEGVRDLCALRAASRTRYHEGHLFDKLDRLVHSREKECRVGAVSQRLI